MNKKRNLILICAVALPATAAIAQLPKVRLPDEAAGLDGIARTLIAAFDQVDIVALGEAHAWKLDSDLRIAVVRHPDFAKKVRSIVVEFGSATEQSTLDRYIRGENVSRAQLEQVWKTTEGRPLASGTLQFTRTSSHYPDACVYVGEGAEVDTKAKPGRSQTSG
jgi:hypothetical protein